MKCMHMISRDRNHFEGQGVGVNCRLEPFRKLIRFNKFNKKFYKESALLNTIVVKHTLNPEITLLYQFHAQKALFKVPKICNINFGIENDSPLPFAPLELFRKFIRFGSATLP